MLHPHQGFGGSRSRGVPLHCTQGQCVGKQPQHSHLAQLALELLWQEGPHWLPMPIKDHTYMYVVQSQTMLFLYCYSNIYVWGVALCCVVLDLLSDFKWSIL